MANFSKHPPINPAHPVRDNGIRGGMIEIRPPYDSIFHPSDFTEASHVAFCHALKLALAAKSSLTLQHATSDRYQSWQEFPGVRETLERWRLLPRGSDSSDVASLGIGVQKVITRGADAVQAVLHFLENHPADLVVLATHPREGRMRWLGQSRAEPIARNAHAPTLFIPHGAAGFVNRADGSVRLRHILIPIATDPSPTSAVQAAAQLAATLGLADVTFHLLHVGEADAMPAVELPGREGWDWIRFSRPGGVVETILHAASTFHADAIVMSTAGHHGFLDALRGSTTERVLHGSECPLLAVPPFA